MARTADHDLRRTQLAQAALAVAGESGLDSVTVARVAATAGFSVGLVQHYFPTKAELMQQAYGHATDRAFDRVAEMVATQEAAGTTIREMVALALTELLPSGAEELIESKVRAEFHGRAAVDPGLAAIAAEFSAKVRLGLRTAIENGRECGETAHGVDAQIAAWQLWCLADGLSAALLHGHDVPTEAAFSDAVQRVFPHPCRRS